MIFRKIRWLVAVVSGILVGANAGVQLWHQLNLELPWISTKPPAIEQVEQKANSQVRGCGLFIYTNSPQPLTLRTRTVILFIVTR